MTDSTMQALETGLPPAPHLPPRNSLAPPQTNPPPQPPPQLRMMQESSTNMVTI